LMMFDHHDPHHDAARLSQAPHQSPRPLC
jgi:hypothetical protein